MYKRITQNQPKTLTVAEAAYLAGIIDGEGCVMIQKRIRQWKPNTRRYYYHRAILAVAQRDIDILSYLKEIVGCGTKIHFSWYGDSRENPKYTGHTIKWGSGVLRWLLPQVLPYLVLKKRQALLAIEFIKLVDRWTPGKELDEEEYKSRCEMYNQMRILNQKPQHKVEEREVPQMSTEKVDLRVVN